MFYKRAAGFEFVCSHHWQLGHVRIGVKIELGRLGRKSAFL